MATPLAHVVFVLDCSSSMSSTIKETSAAFDAFVDTLKKTKGAEIQLTLIEYRTSSQLVYTKPIQDVGPLEYKPNSGYDTLYDAVHYAVKVASKETRANKKVICILCDGGDNYSAHTSAEAKALIESKLKEGWEFCFLAAGNCAAIHGARNGAGWEDVVGGPAEVAKRIGIPAGSILKYAQENGRDNGAVVAFGQTAWQVGAFTSGRAEHVTHGKGA